MMPDPSLAALLRYFVATGNIGLLYGFDIWYLFLVIPAFLVSLMAQASVRNTFNRYNQITARSGYTGQAAARTILDHHGLTSVQIEQVPGQLTDSFDPRTETLRLSEATYNSRSIAAIGVAAHEAGHAVQHNTGYLPNRLRRLLVPVAQIGSTFGPYLAIFGLLFSLTTLFEIGIVLYAGAMLFYIVTLPIEFNASSRAIRVLEDEGLLDDDELRSARKVLRAAAMTYVASALVAFATLSRLVLVSRDRNGRQR
jgi:uncharacterized protein